MFKCSICYTQLFQSWESGFYVCKSCGLVDQNTPIFVHEIPFIVPHKVYNREEYLNHNMNHLNLSIKQRRIVAGKFHDVYKAFRNIHHGRKNFLNYKYVSWRILQLFYDKNIILMHLKTGFKVREHDVIWKKICYRLDWEFI